MPVVTTGKTWANGDAVTPANLNLQFSGAAFASGAVDDSSTALSGGAIIVKDLGVGTAKIAAEAVTTAKIADNAVTVAKLASTLDLSSNTVTLADDIISTSKIADDAVTYAKVATATQGQMEAESAAGVVTPDVLTYHPGVVKAYGKVAFANGDATLTGTYNVGSAVESGTTRVVTLGVTMASSDYCIVLSGQATGVTLPPIISGQSSNTFTISWFEAAGNSVSFAVYGDLA